MAARRPIGRRWRRPDDQALAEALARNIYGAPAPVPAAARLAAYMREAIRDLKAQDSARLAAGALRFPEPAAVPADAG